MENHLIIDFLSNVYNYGFSRLISLSDYRRACVFVNFSLIRILPVLPGVEGSMALLHP